MLVVLGIARELTAVDGPKSNGRVERRITLVSEGAKAAFVEFQTNPPALLFPLAQSPTRPFGRRPSRE